MEAIFCVWIHYGDLDLHVLKLTSIPVPQNLDEATEVLGADIVSLIRWIFHLVLA